MDFKLQIEQFIPFNEQEEIDKQQFLGLFNKFNDVLTRNNTFGHLTASAFVVNKNRTKILLVYHNIYDGYIFPGGHADDNADLLSVAKREVTEETGLKPTVLNNNIFALHCFPVSGHVKKGKYVSAHTHYDVAFIMEADDAETPQINQDENQSVIWADFSEIGKSITLVDFFVPAYEKFIEKLKYFE